MTTSTTLLDSPLGPLLLTASDDGITELRFADRAQPPDARVPPAAAHDDPRFAEARRQLEEYFAGTRVTFDLPLRPTGGPFTQRVWAELATVPHGAVTTYGELARRIGAPGSARAVGTANARNPICILVPCHRVLGSSGALTGYAGGLERKRTLLELERGVLAAA